MTNKATSSGRKKKRKPSASTTARGYGWTHVQARNSALAALRDGDLCAQCALVGKRHPMFRAASPLLDLSHTDDRKRYIGLSWRACNRRDGAVRGNAKRKPQPMRYSRVW